MAKAVRKTGSTRKLASGRKPHAKTHARRKAPVRKARAHKSAARKSTRRWSSRVTETSDAMTLDEGVFKKSDPKAIARSVKRSAERSHRRKSAPFRSAMSMLTFYINRGGRNLSARRKHVLMEAKDELRALYQRE